MIIVEKLIYACLNFAIDENIEMMPDIGAVQLILNALKEHKKVKLLTVYHPIWTFV